MNPVCFASTRELLDSGALEKPGCLILDVRMPGTSGLDLQHQLASSGNPKPIIFLTGQGDIPTTVKAMRHGAEDFLTKRSPKEDLLAAVKRALERDARERKTRIRTRELSERFEVLTSREREVLTHVLRGQLNKQIAADLGVDERSVKRHRTSLMSKLQVNSVADLVKLAGYQPQGEEPDEAKIMASFQEALRGRAWLIDVPNEKPAPGGAKDAPGGAGATQAQPGGKPGPGADHRPVAVPVMGRIAAGTPIEALQTRSHTISVPPDMLGSGEHYALEVRGDSMVDAGILDGDMALIQRNDTADTGDIVVALIDEEEATLKRFRRRGASIALEPANTSYEVRILPPNRVRIQGKLIGLYRKY